MNIRSQVQTAGHAATTKPQEAPFRSFSRTNGTLPVMDYLRDSCSALVRSGALDSYETEQHAVDTFAQVGRLTRRQAEILWVRFTTPSTVATR